MYRLYKNRESAQCDHDRVFVAYDCTHNWCVTWLHCGDITDVQQEGAAIGAVTYVQLYAL
jgi:hypothetical protein